MTRRKPLAPVFVSKARLAKILRAGVVILNWAPYIEKRDSNCFTRAFLGSVKTRT